MGRVYSGWILLFRAMGLALLAGVISAPGAVLLSDTFSDGERSTQNLPGSAKWFTRETAGTSVSGGQLVTSPSADMRGGIAYLDAAQTIDVLYEMTLMFQYSFSTAFSQDYSFLFGLYNSGGTKMTADGAFNSATFFNDAGYVAAGIFAADPSGGGRYHLHERTSGANNLITAANMPMMGSAIKQTGAAAINTPYTASLTLQRTGIDTMVIRATIDGQTLIRTDSVSVVTSFDQIGIFGLSGVGTLKIDNVYVTYQSMIPEPSTVGLVGISLAALWRARRRVT